MGKPATAFARLQYLFAFLQLKAENKLN